MSDECIFCKIVAGKIPTEKVMENEHVVAFNDINPKAPTHVLVVPREHFATLNDVPADKGEILTKVLEAAREIARKQGIAEDGYRVIVNTNANAGQEVFHIHFHVMGGRPMGSMG